jgi:seryl-tRNA synthetase
MYDIKWIRDNSDAFDRGLKRRGLEPLSQHLISIDARRRAIIRVHESWQATRNSASKEIGEAKKAKDEARIAELMSKVAEAKTSISTLESEQKAADEELHKALSEIPNMPLDDVPDGTSAEENVDHHQFGNKRNYAFKPKQHFELGGALGQMDFELAAKLSGARFVVLQKGLARLERALGQFMLDLHTEQHGYAEIDPPLLVRDHTMFGTAQLPKFRDDQYATLNTAVEHLERLKLAKASLVGRIDGIQRKLDYQKSRRQRFFGFPNFSARSAIEHLTEFMSSLHVESAQFEQQIEVFKKLTDSIDRELWLIPTAEVPLTNLVRESIVEEDKLPMRLTACTPCFRAEAGAAGKDTRGMIRQHQFTKVELVSITTPEKSYEEHERMLACAEEVLKKLDLHYRVVTLCTGDMGFAAQKTYDIEVWLPGQGAYREISSCSNCGEFQARRMDARYKGKDGKVKGHVHTLNGSGVAVGRALIAVMETYQDDKGAIVVPDALKPYMGGMSKIERA